jgi:membrane-associated phospholipid phosphatase
LRWPSIQEVCANAFPHYYLWLMTAALVAFNFVFIIINPQIELTPRSIPIPLLLLVAGAALAGLRAVLADKFNWLRHRAYCLVMVLSLQSVFSSAIHVYNHLLMANNIPLADDLLLSWDRALGLDWLAYANAMTQSAGMVNLLAFAYFPLTSLPIGIILMIAIFFDNRRLVLELISLLSITALVCVTLSALFPALAATATLAPQELLQRLPDWAGTYHLDALKALRSDAVILLDSAGLNGLATFPSYHTCIALVIAWCLRGTWPTALLGTMIAVLVLASTPIMGGHYFVDIIAGVAVTLTTIIIWNGFVASRATLMFGQTFPLPNFRSK